MEKNNVDKMLTDVGYEKPIQTKIGEELLPTMQGFIRSLVITPREGKDSMYKFQIRYLDSNDDIVEPETWYSGFKHAPGQNGDYIHFSFKINGLYNNVKDVLDIKLTSTEPREKDKKEIRTLKDLLVTPTISTDMVGDNVDMTPVLAPESLTQPYSALLLNATIQLCTKRGTLTHEEIVAQFNKFLQIL